MLYLRPRVVRRLAPTASCLVALVTCWVAALPESARAAANDRQTPIVKAVREAAPAVVNIQGQKSVTDPAAPGRTSAPREVNGMGTGVVIDSRGYILTNFHVVDGVRQINVTLAGGQAYVAQIVAHDRETDLAIIRIRTPEPLPTIRLGTSHDLMTGETVVALGNAYGYEHTVTTGIISAQHRNVQVNETQQYLDLIQTDASINPGNSGGPLMNIDGEMIGLNVAVRAGAQGIGFAIPVDNALDVATRLLDVEKLENKRHGILPLADHGAGEQVKVARVERDSPAASGGLRQGDELLRIGSTDIARTLDVERAMLGRSVGETVPVEISRDGRTIELEIVVAAKPGRTRDIQPVGSFQEATWDAFGMILEPESAGTLKSRGLPLEGGMRVVAVRPGSAAAEQMVAKGDILVQIHRWYTTSAQDVQYILNRADSIAKMGPVRFDIVRGKERFYGQMALKTTGETVRR